MISGWHDDDASGIRKGPKRRNTDASRATGAFFFFFLHSTILTKTNYLQLTTCQRHQHQHQPPSSSLDEHEGLETPSILPFLPTSFDEHEGFETRQNASRDLLLPPSAPVSPPPGPETHLGPWFSLFFPFFHFLKARDMSRAFFLSFFIFFFIFTKPETRLGLCCLCFVFLLYFLPPTIARDALGLLYLFLSLLGPDPGSEWRNKVLSFGP